MTLGLKNYLIQKCCLVLNGYFHQVQIKKIEQSCVFRGDQTNSVLWIAPSYCLRKLRSNMGRRFIFSDTNKNNSAYELNHGRQVVMARKVRVTLQMG